MPTACEACGGATDRGRFLELEVPPAGDVDGEGVTVTARLCDGCMRIVAATAPVATVLARMDIPNPADEGDAPDPVVDLGGVDGEGESDEP